MHHICGPALSILAQNVPPGSASTSTSLPFLLYQKETRIFSLPCSQWVWETNEDKVMCPPNYLYPLIHFIPSQKKKILTNSYYIHLSHFPEETRCPERKCSMSCEQTWRHKSQIAVARTEKWLKDPQQKSGSLSHYVFLLWLVSLSEPWCVCVHACVCNSLQKCVSLSEQCSMQVGAL